MSDNNSPTIQASGYLFTPEQNFQGLNTKLDDRIRDNIKNGLAANHYSPRKNYEPPKFRLRTAPGNGGKRRKRTTQRRRKRKTSN